jgi:fido (protein-threonine AMPylation protein)
MPKCGHRAGICFRRKAEVRRRYNECMNDDVRSGQPLKWAPHELATYDSILGMACATEFRRLAGASSQERLKFICDTREVHNRLYAPLAPVEHPEYAGTYRGTPGTSLEGRRSGVLREDDGSFQGFAAPDKVVTLLKMVEDQAKKIFDLPSSASANIVLAEIVRLFYCFGLIHPFLDGNGHVQRLIFATCVMERSSLQLSETWTIHPRPYDIEIKLAFEAPTINARLAVLYEVLAAYVVGRDWEVPASAEIESFKDTP